MPQDNRRRRRSIENYQNDMSSHDNMNIIILHIDLVKLSFFGYYYL